MEIKNGTVILEETNGIELFNFSDYMEYTEISGTKVKIPVKTLLRLHSILQFEVERACGRSFEEFCNSVMDKKDD